MASRKSGNSRGKPEVEKIYDKYAKQYSEGDFPPSKLDTARSAMGFADDITWFYIKKYLPKDKSSRILEAGAGDGYWAQKVIELGYENIVVSDLSQGMLDEAKKRFSKTSEKVKLEFVKSDIADMKEFRENMFDFAFSQYDAVSLSMKSAKAMKELARVSKKGAHVVVCLDTKYRRVSELIEAGLIEETRELLDTNVSHDFNHPQYNLTWEELSEHFENAGLEVKEVVGAPVFMHQVRYEVLKEFERDPQTRKTLLDFELENCTNRSLVNFAGHLQMVGRKR
jgi:ubiquinone/menaquinone biosynthesis C-methylase UbiE